MTSTNPNVQLNRHAERRLATQHPWIYSNEIHESVDLKRLKPGELVDILDRHGKYVGTGFVNPHSLIAVRFLTRVRDQEINFVERFRQAIRLRELVYGPKSHARSTYRAVFGESDNLPGLIVDRYQGVWVMEFHALGMQERAEQLHLALKQAVTEECGAESWQALVVRSDVKVAQREGMKEVEAAVVDGTLPSRVIAIEGDIEFRVDPIKGQKTGFFFDQRENRRHFAELIKLLNKPRVLDAYCHVGAWGLQALKAGAAHVKFIDLSDDALESIKESAKKIEVLDRCEFVKSDVLDAIRSLDKNSLNAISLDPPAFVSSKKNMAQGIRAYFTNNQVAARLLQPESILSTSSCSFHVEELGFQEMVAGAILQTGRLPQILRRGDAAMDHPALAHVPETKYLKNLLLRL
jgi:23S rRNA (cytosine1962-C5)-methyltransferase